MSQIDFISGMSLRNGAAISDAEARAAWDAVGSHKWSEAAYREMARRILNPAGL